MFAANTIIYAQWTGGGSSSSGNSGVEFIAPPLSTTGSFSGGSSFEKGGSGNLTYTAQKDASYLKDVRVDGVLLTKDLDYKVESGTTKITLNAAYLNTLSPSQHTMVVSFTDGASTLGTFTVRAAASASPPQNPSTGAGI